MRFLANSGASLVSHGKPFGEKRDPAHVGVGRRGPGVFGPAHRLRADFALFGDGGNALKAGIVGAGEANGQRGVKCYGRLQTLALGSKEMGGPLQTGGEAVLEGMTPGCAAVSPAVPLGGALEEEDGVLQNFGFLSSALVAALRNNERHFRN